MTSWSNNSPFPRQPKRRHVAPITSNSEQFTQHIKQLKLPGSLIAISVKSGGSYTARNHYGIVTSTETTQPPGNAERRIRLSRHCRFIGGCFLGSQRLPLNIYSRTTEYDESRVHSVAFFLSCQSADRTLFDRNRQSPHDRLPLQSSSTTHATVGQVAAVNLGGLSVQFPHTIAST